MGYYDYDLFDLNQPFWKPVDDFLKEYATSVTSDNIDELARDFSAYILGLHPMDDDQSVGSVTIEYDCFEDRLGVFEFISEQLMEELHDVADDSWEESLKGYTSVDDVLEIRVKQILKTLI